MDLDQSTLGPEDSRSSTSGSTSGTHWTVVSTAGKGSSPDARAAFGQLYQSYRPALLAFLRQKGSSTVEADDLLNGFFEHLLESNALAKVNRGGRFRNWLLKSLRNYATDLWQKQQTQKRWGKLVGAPVGSDFEAGEVEPVDARLSPEQAYDRKWAIALLGRALERLASEYRQSGQEVLFNELRPFISGKGDFTGYDDLGAKLNLRPNTVAVNVKRMRARYRELLLAEISDTVDPGMIDEEWQHLQQAICAQPDGSSPSQSLI